MATAIGLSLLLNALLFSVLDLGSLVRSATVVQRPVALAPLSASQWDANRAISGAMPQQPAPRPPELARPPPPRPAPESERRPAGQVVHAAPGNDQAPKDSRFLSDRDSSVEKETISRFRSNAHRNMAAVPSSPAARPNPGDGSTAQRGAQGAESGRAQVNRPGTPSLPSVSSRAPLALAPDANGELANRSARPGVRGSDAELALGTPGAPDDQGKGTNAEGGARPGALDPAKLKPSAAFYDRLEGGPKPDHVEGVEEGDGTFLNTRKWKFAGYFNRIHDSIATHWDPVRQLEARDPGRNRFGEREWVTVLEIVLDDHGALKDIDVARSSGLDFLDREALEAVQKAQPFINPPTGLPDDKGEIAFRFGFNFDTTGRVRMFRQPAR